jgi:SNF2 family DNA or RNA helicase
VHAVNKGNDKQDRELVTIKDSKKDITGKLDDDVDVDDLAAAFGSIGLRSQPCLVCQEPFKPSQAGDKQCRECMTILNHSRRDGSPDDNGPEASTKIIKLIELLKQMKKEDPDRKALVFSQFTSMFDILQPFLKRAGIKYVVCESNSRILFQALIYTDGGPFSQTMAR